MVGLLRATWSLLDGVLEEVGREIDSLKSKNFEEILK
jgi:hypothetical protein